MKRKDELKQQIKAAEAEIAELEQKRLRSQSSLLEAMLAKTEPNATDAEYFRTLSSIIKLQREKLQLLNEELKSLD